MCVAGHGVPVTAGGELRQAHRELAGLHDAGIDELVDGALVAAFERADIALDRVLERDKLVFIAAMRRGAGHVKARGILRVVAGEQYFLRALGQIQAVFIAQVIFYAVGLDCARSAEIEHTDLTAFEEIVRAEVCPHVEALVDGDSLAHRHTAHRDHAVNMAVNGDDLVGLVQAGD